jgi:hypothetical protein
VDADIDHRLAKGVDKANAMASINAQLERLGVGQWMCEYFDKITELTQKLTEYAMTGHCRLDASRKLTGLARSKSSRSVEEEGSTAAVSSEPVQQQFMVITGGGPGFMEAVCPFDLLISCLLHR